MPYDPNLPQADTEIDAVQMRGQLNGLKDLIDAIQTLTGAQIDGVSTLPPGDPASVTVSVNGSTLYFSFGIPQGAEGVPGPAGSTGSSGSDGAPGPQGAPGEVQFSDLNNAISGTSSNSNAVSLLNMGVSDPPTQAEVQQIVGKIDELINALRR